MQPPGMQKLCGHLSVGADVQATAVMPYARTMVRENTPNDGQQDAWWKPYITHVPGVQGGAAVVRGTRTPVRTIVARLREYVGDVSQVRSALPHLNEREFRAAQTYYEQHQAEIEADEQRHARALNAFVSNARS